MKIIVLGSGTSTGIPVIGCNCKVCQSQDSRDKRLRSSLYIEVNRKKIVIDTGPDFRIQMLNNHLSDLDAVIFTHNHKDHTGGLDDIRPINYILEKRVDVFAEKYVQQTLKMEYPYIFQEQDYPGVPQISLHTIDESPFFIENVKFIPIRVWHKNLPVLAFRIGNFTYLTDANRIEEPELDKIRGSEVLIINALRRETHYSHFSLSQALEIINQVQPQTAYLTHIGHHLGLFEEVQRELPQNVFLCYDGLTLDMKSDGCF
ncbi:MAG: MBL fold metallo-hydrolase [Chitinophagales bacterium]|nr:MBL fold metallo-hydrolase [Chitinophagales bacterium]MCZ2394522.1 MBL fold metallo-hydrolase [Chitinophagales bacterium]